MAIFVILVIFLFIIILLFSSKKFSPIPYFPTQKADLSKIIKALKLKDNQTVIDLGAGDGIVVFRAAYEAQKQKLNTKFVAVEINPVLVLILHLRRLFHPNHDNIKIVLGDMFKIDYASQIRQLADDMVMYFYISPWFLEKVVSRIKNLGSSVSIVSYMYPIKSLKNREKEIRGKNLIFAYDL